MPLDLLILIILVVTSYILAPLYFSLREKMTNDSNKEKPVSYFTKSRVKNFFLMVLSTIFTVFFFSIVMLVGIKQRSLVPQIMELDMAVLFFYTFFWMIISTGIGLYVSGVFVEQYSMNDIKKDPEYSRIKVATKLLHGHLSHLCIFSGGFAVLFILSLFEVINPTKSLPLELNLIYAVLGVALGVLYAWGQLKNLTWRHQVHFFILLFLAQIISVVLFQVDLNFHPFNIFFLLFSGTACFTLLVKWFRRKFADLI